ncbi:MAG TPA: OsmC family protein [Candidatus Limnocylindria bacterium]
MGRILVVREAGVRFTADVRGHRVTYDQPIEAGGTDAGPTPTESFVASLAGCAAYYVERFLERHGLSADGLSVAADFSMAQHPSRVDVVEITIELGGELPDALRAPLLAVAQHCTVHNSIAAAPDVRIELGTRVARGAGVLSRLAL